ncbi:unnamed protein product [Symbiodinium natans]|uniref:Uncharacterized protein n=1 Tax=Symbiodinium natans TaxID=878477 RepID=A0A812HQ99_9DINO|nr:unnamed protein product [Symbiodinium natans]
MLVVSDMCVGAVSDGRLKKEVASLAAQFGFSLARQKKRVVDYDCAHRQQTLKASKTPSSQQEKRLEARSRRMDRPERLDADKLRAVAARVSRSESGVTGVSSPEPQGTAARRRASMQAGSSRSASSKVCA